jgi:serine/threonine protein kinase
VKPPDPDEHTHQGPVETTNTSQSLSDYDHTMVSNDPLVGTAVGDFKVMKKLGVGGMGVVYEGVAKSGQRVAIKVLKPELALDADYVKRLTNEARAVASLKHPGIVEVLSVGALSSGRPYVVMEYLAGQSVEEWAVEHAPLPVEAVRSLGAQICSILAAVHAKGIVHRDLKGDNMVWVIPISGPPRVKLLDFGVAKINRTGGAMAETHSTKMVGTPAVMSPEQIRAEPITQVTDLYALGAVLYRLLTGNYPFESPSMAEVLMKHLDEPPLDPRMLRTDIPDGLAKLVLRLLEKNPADRPQTAAEVELALAPPSPGGSLGEGAEQPTSVMPSQATVPLQAPLRANPFSDLDQGQSDVNYVAGKTQNSPPPQLATEGPVPQMPGTSDSGFVASPSDAGIGRDTLDEPAASPAPPPKRVKPSRSTDRMPAQGQGTAAWFLLIPITIGLAVVGIAAREVMLPWQSSGAPRAAVEPSKPAPPPVAAVAPPPVVTAPASAPAPVVKPPPAVKIPSVKQLLARADAFADKLKKRRSKNKKAPVELRKLRRKAETASDDNTLVGLGADLDAWEKEYLK